MCKEKMWKEMIKKVKIVERNGWKQVGKMQRQGAVAAVLEVCKEMIKVWKEMVKNVKIKVKEMVGSRLVKCRDGVQ